jgi:hypothetical protein
MARNHVHAPSHTNVVPIESHSDGQNASSRRSRGCEAKDGRFDGVGCRAVEVGPNYPSLDVIFFLAHRDILVFSFPINRTPSVGGEKNIQPSLSHSLAIDAF